MSRPIKNSPSILDEPYIVEETDEVEATSTTEEDTLRYESSNNTKEMEELKKGFEFILISPAGSIFTLLKIHRTTEVQRRICRPRKKVQRTRRETCKSNKDRSK